MKVWTLLLATLLVAASLDAEAARRLGGGGSTGRQSDSAAQQRPGAPAQAPAATPAPAQPQAAAAPAAARGAPAAPAAAKRPWGGLLGGLAAGLGLAWLAQSLGLGAAFAQGLLLALLALLVLGGVAIVLRARRTAHSASGLAPAERAAALPQYSPDKVGNDASARPWERNSMAFDAARYGAAAQNPGAQPASQAGGSRPWGVPDGFDAPAFVAAAKRNFVALQDAWDRSDLRTLRAMMTDEMVHEIRAQLAEREAARGGQPNQTDVVMLDARLLGVEDIGAHYLASVEFSGMIREEPSAGPSPFREVWNMAKPKDGSTGWLVAGVQALQ